MRSLEGAAELYTSSPSCPSGIQFEVKRVELQGSATLFCCWLVKDLFHSHRDSATRTRLFLASLPSSTHSMPELSGSSFGEVGICGQLSLLCTFYCAAGFPGSITAFLAGMGGGYAYGFLTLSSSTLCKYKANVGL